MMIFGLLFLLIFWGVLIALAIWLVRSLFTSNQRFSGTSPDRELNAGEILNQRYARGEITREQYELMKSDLV
jgi:putative membrane protein